jgi:hypothetical protein
MSTVKARALRARFKGRITSKGGTAGGRALLLVPETAEDIGRAIALARAAGRTVFVRSGGQAFESAAAAAPARARYPRSSPPPAPPSSVSRPSTASRSTTRAFASVPRPPSATSQRPLDHRALFVPLEDLPSRSLASAALADRLPAFPRSAPRQTMWEGIVEATIVRTGPDDAGTTETLDASAWKAFREQGGGVITEIVIDASRWVDQAKERWLRVWMLPYSREDHAVLCRSLFDKKAPAKVDVSLRVSSGAYGEALMVLRVSGQGEDKSEAARTFVTKAINDARSRVLWSRKIDGAGSAAAAWVGTGPGRANDGDRYREIVWEAPWATDKTPFVDAVDTLVRQGGWVDLHLGSAAGSVVRRVLAPSAVAIPPALFPPSRRSGVRARVGRCRALAARGRRRTRRGSSARPRVRHPAESDPRLSWRGVRARGRRRWLPACDRAVRGLVVRRGDRRAANDTAPGRLCRRCEGRTACREVRGGQRAPCRRALGRSPVLRNVLGRRRHAARRRRTPRADRVRSTEPPGRGRPGGSRCGTSRVPCAITRSRFRTANARS